MLTDSKGKPTRIGLIIFVVFLLSFSLFIGFQLTKKETKALGGGFSDLVTNTVTSNTTTNAFTVGAQYAIDGNYFIVSTATFSPSISVSSISDTASNTWTKAVSSSKFEDAEIWYMNYTKSQFASFTITVTFSSSTESITQYQLLTGVVTGSLQTVKNNGTATSLSVASFTPNAFFSCQNYADALTGSATTAFGLSNFWYTRAANHLGATNFWSNTQLNNVWQPSFGATTITTTMSPTASPQWDNVVACFPQGPSTSTTTTTTSTSTTTTTTNPTMPSGGIQQFVQNQTTGTATTKLEGSFNANSAIGKPVINHFLIVSIFVPSGNSTVSTIGDTQTNTFTKLVSLNAQGDNELWISSQLATTAIDLITVTVSTKTVFQLVAYEVSGITTNTPDTTASNSGISSTASVNTVSVPLNDFCIAPIGLAGTLTTPARASIPFGVFLASSTLLVGSGASLPSIVANNMNGSQTNAQSTLTLSDNWNELLSCFPSSNVNTVTATTTNTAVLEPANSTDAYVLLGVLLIQLTLSFIGIFAKRVIFALINIFPMILAVINVVQVQTNPNIVYGNTQFLATNTLYIVLAFGIVFNLVGIIVPLMYKKFV